MSANTVLPEPGSLVERLLKITDREDLYDDLFWRFDGVENPGFSIRCNDFFYWACSDLEEIETGEDLDLLEKSCEDAPGFGAELYCARRRKQRPQGAYYKYLEERHHALFDACGPHREDGPGNPVARGTP